VLNDLTIIARQLCRPKLDRQRKVVALVVTPDTLFGQRREQVIALAARGSLPANYWDPMFPKAGGLMSYGSTVAESYRQLGMYVGRILHGDKPADLPVQRSYVCLRDILSDLAAALAGEQPQTVADFRTTLKIATVRLESGNPG
jgi:ABC-type uncharacterized transport system substrate-binding protein